MAQVSVEIVEHVGHRATATATVRQGRDVATATVTIDLSEGSELEQRLQQTDLGRHRLGRARATLLERVQDRALHQARDKLLDARLSPAERKERDIRGPLQAMSAGLRARADEYREITDAIRKRDR